jgi:histidinol phosphatase-like enzyme
MGLDLNGSYLIGDAATDIQAGQQVGCQTILVLTGRGKEEIFPALDSTGGRLPTTRANLKEAAEHILKVELGLVGEKETKNLTRYHQLLAAANLLASI